MKTQTRRGPSAYVIGGIFLIVGFAIGYVTGFRYATAADRRPASVPLSQEAMAQAAGQPLDVKAAEIVAELNCICGCKMVLSTCTCDEVQGSKELKGFVQDLVNKGSARADVLNRLKEKYGEKVLIKKQV